jgi:hypothetical protein
MINKNNIKEIGMEKNFHYTVCQIDVLGRLVNKEHLNHNELDVWMENIYGQYAKIRVERSDGKWVVYEDNGSNWEVIHKGNSI